MPPIGFRTILKRVQDEMESRSLKEVRLLRLLLSLHWGFTEDQHFEMLDALLTLEDLKKLPETQKIDEKFNEIIKPIQQDMENGGFGK